MLDLYFDVWEVLRVEKVNSIPNSVCGKLYCKSVWSGDAQERRHLVYPREKWDISEVPDLPWGESGWETYGVWKRRIAVIWL